MLMGRANVAIPTEFREIFDAILVTEIEEIQHGSGKQLGIANLRDLHAWLGSKADYTTWLDRKAKALGFSETVDFAENLIPSNLKELQPSDKTGPKPTSHRCTLRMAWGEDRISQVARAKGEGPWVFRSY